MHCGKPRHSHHSSPLSKLAQLLLFAKPLDNIGAKSIPDYATYAASFIHTITIPGCNTPGKVFVGQRKDPFVVNLGETFDLVNIKYPAEELAPGGVGGGGRALAPNTLADSNVTSLELEVPTACLTAGSETVIGGWTTSSIRQAACAGEGYWVSPSPNCAAIQGRTSDSSQILLIWASAAVLPLGTPAFVLSPL